MTSEAIHPTTEQGPPRPSIAVLFSTNAEAGGLIDMMSNTVVTKCVTFVEHAGEVGGRPTVVAVIGTSNEQLQRATRDVLTICKPRWVIASGFASSLSEPLQRGQILFVDSVADVNGGQLGLELMFDRDSLTAATGTHVGRLLSADYRVVSADRRRELASQQDAVALDTDTMLIARSCRTAGVRCMAVRAIIDSLDEPLPLEVDRLGQQSTIAGKLGVAVGSLWRRPSSAQDFLNVQENRLLVADRLGKYLCSVIGQLPD